MTPVTLKAPVTPIPMTADDAACVAVGDHLLSTAQAREHYPDLSEAVEVKSIKGAYEEDIYLLVEMYDFSRLWLHYTNFSRCMVPSVATKVKRGDFIRPVPKFMDTINDPAEVFMTRPECGCVKFLVETPTKERHWMPHYCFMNTFRQKRATEAES